MTFFMDTLNCYLIKIADIKSSVTETFYLGYRTAGDNEELAKFLVAAAIKSFSDICHRRNSCPLYLVTKAVIPAAGEQAISFLHQATSLLPSINILKSLYFHMVSTLNLEHGTLNKYAPSRLYHIPEHFPVHPARIDDQL